MKDKLKRKLRSRQGVTLVLSLLAFLVCAMAASVLITAGTASSGTVSQRAKMDQRYFSVTSAVELLRKTFDGKSVVVTVTFDEYGNWTGGSTPEGVTVEEKFVVDQSLYVFSQLRDADWNYGTDANALRTNADNWAAKPYAVTVSDSTLADVLNAVVTIDNSRPEELKFTVTSDIQREGQSEQEKFSLTVKYVASVLKEVKTTADGKEILFRVDWKIGAVS